MMFCYGPLVYSNFKSYSFRGSLIKWGKFIVRGIHGNVFLFSAFI